MSDAEYSMCLPGVKIVAAAILDRRTGRFLAARRTYPPTLSGLWEFPGGKIEPGEEAEEALRRECLEELGAEIVVGQELLPRQLGEEPWEGWKLKGSLRMRVFLCLLPEAEEGDETKITSEIVLSSGHDDAKWLPFSPEAFELPWIPENLPILEALIGQEKQALG